MDDVLFEEYKDKEYPHGLKYFLSCLLPSDQIQTKNITEDNVYGERKKMLNRYMERTRLLIEGLLGKLKRIMDDYRPKEG